MEVEFSCYGGGQFKGGRIIVTKVASLKEGEWSSYTWSAGEGEWSCYRGCHFNGGRMVMLQK